MKLIDAKGRLFGKLNILDIAIFIVVTVTLVSIYMAIVHKDKLKNILLGEDESWYTTIKVIIDEDRFWLKDYIQIGDLRKDVYERMDWQILKIEEVIDPNKQKRLLVKLRIMANKERTGAVYYGKYDLIIGGEIILVGKDYILKGTIYDVGELEQKVAF